MCSSVVFDSFDSCVVVVCCSVVEILYIITEQNIYRYELNI